MALDKGRAEEGTASVDLTNPQAVVDGFMVDLSGDATEDALVYWINHFMG